MNIFLMTQIISENNFHLISFFFKANFIHFVTFTSEFD